MPQHTDDDQRLIEAYKTAASQAEKGRIAGSIHRRHVRLVGKLFNSWYPKWWLDTQSYIHLCAALDSYDAAKGTKFPSWWVARLRRKLPDEWYGETHPMPMPSNPGQYGITRQSLRERSFIDFNAVIADIDGEDPGFFREEDCHEQNEQDT